MNPSIAPLIAKAGTVILGKEQQIKMALACFLAKGHLLIEDIPGIGKTTLAQALARLMGLEFQRIQCTNDLLPGDILGVSVYERSTGRFTFHPGPIFAQAVLVDEINRAAPKTQSGLLEAMAEGQVTLDRERFPLAKPFFVIATQNQQDQIGTYPLPESQLDRFLMSIQLGYPDREAEITLLQGDDRSELLSALPVLLSPAAALTIQQQVLETHASAALLQYTRNLLDFTRQSPEISLGLSPRAGLALLHCAKSWAFIDHRTYVLPEDVQTVFAPVAGHRLKFRADYSETEKREALDSLLENVPVP
jgi:MoxR-like ATPase